MLSISYNVAAYSSPQMRSTNALFKLYTKANKPVNSCPLFNRSVGLIDSKVGKIDFGFSRNDGAHRIALSGLGVFTVVKRARRTEPPRTGEAVTIKAHKAVRFRPAKTLKETAG